MAVVCAATAAVTNEFTLVLDQVLPDPVAPSLMVLAEEARAFTSLIAATRFVLAVVDNPERSAALPFTMVRSALHSVAMRAMS